MDRKQMQSRVLMWRESKSYAIELIKTLALWSNQTFFFFSYSSPLLFLSITLSIFTILPSAASNAPHIAGGNDENDFFWIVHDIACVAIKSRFSNSHAPTLNSKWKFPFHFAHFEYHFKYSMYCCSLLREIFSQWKQRTHSSFSPFFAQVFLITYRAHVLN